MKKVKQEVRVVFTYNQDTDMIDVQFKYNPELDMTATGGKQAELQLLAVRLVKAFGTLVKGGQNDDT